MELTQQVVQQAAQRSSDHMLYIDADVDADADGAYEAEETTMRTMMKLYSVRG